MDESRWPQFIRDFVDQAAAGAESLAIQVGYCKPRIDEFGWRWEGFWTVRLVCECCKIGRSWQVLTDPPLPLPEAIPVPSSFREMFG